MQSRTINFYTFIRLAGILLGTATVAFGVVAFVLPSGIMIGSCTGIARIVHHYMAIPISYTVFAGNGLLFAFGAVMLGKKFAASTLVGSFSYPLFMNLFEQFPALQHLTQNSFLAMVYGGILAGIGMGIVIRMGASTGGTDIVAVVLNKKAGLPLSIPMYLLDFTILLSQVIFAESADQILLGILLTLLYSIIADKVSVAGSSAVQLFIISQKTDEIRRKFSDLVIGATIFYGETNYTAAQQNTILCVTTSRDLHHVQQEALRIDPQAFITVSQIKEVKGRGYSFDVGLVKELRRKKTSQI
ncbi:YitT family protein [Ihubacter sp. rT4E-8]|uniref:YitT family protein n=1 Tax=Ihubacter sp. rT4E-8 TaxID=3242369 RepID=UPI003CF28BCD